MATARVRGKWVLSLSVSEGVSAAKIRSIGEAELKVSAATRAGLSGDLRIGEQTIKIKGRVKPGSPAVVTLFEDSAEGKSGAHGLEAIFYIPPWWPNVDYSYDMILGTLLVGKDSALRDKKLKRGIIAVTGVQLFE